VRARVRACLSLYVRASALRLTARGRCGTRSRVWEREGGEEGGDDKGMSMGTTLSRPPARHRRRRGGGRAGGRRLSVFLPACLSACLPVCLALPRFAAEGGGAGEGRVGWDGMDGVRWERGLRPLDGSLDMRRARFDSGLGGLCYVPSGTGVWGCLNRLSFPDRIDVL